MLSRLVRATALVPLLATALACGGEPAEEQTAEQRAPLVEAVPARFGALPVEEVVPGTVRARNQVAIRPETAGRIVEVPAEIGQAVPRGRLLVRLDDAEARERLRQAEADLRLAEASAAAAAARVSEIAARVARSRTLAEQQLLSAQEMETLEAQLAATRASADESLARVEQRRAAVAEMRSALDKTEVRAPVAGRLGERRAEIGMRVDPSTVLFVIGDPDELIVEVNLTETMLARVAAGLPVVIAGRGAAAEPIPARLSRISPFLAAESFTTVAEIDVQDPAGWLRPGMFVTVRILVGESQRATLVPTSALWSDPASGRRGVYVIRQTAGLEPPAAPASAAGGQLPADAGEPRAVEFQPVEVLAQGRAAAGVTGVEEGSWVVTVGQHLLGADSPAAASGQARVRPVSWERVLELQELQDEDLLEGFLDKQRKVAAALGAKIPDSEEEVERVLAAAAEPAPPRAR